MFRQFFFFFFLWRILQVSLCSHSFPFPPVAFRPVVLCIRPSILYTILRNFLRSFLSLSLANNYGDLSIDHFAFSHNNEEMDSWPGKVIWNYIDYNRRQISLLQNLLSFKSLYVCFILLNNDYIYILRI